MSEEQKSHIDKSLEIIRKTNDGALLSPSHLYIVESAVNGHLNKKGLEVFDNIYEMVKNGKYVEPWFHNIENMTTDHEGYVYWKKQKIEHFESPYAYTHDAKEYLMSLVPICQALENLNIKVNIVSVISQWDRIQKASELTKSSGAEIGLYEAYSLLSIIDEPRTPSCLEYSISHLNNNVNVPRIIVDLQEKQFILRKGKLLEANHEQIPAMFFIGTTDNQQIVSV